VGFQLAALAEHVKYFNRDRSDFARGPEKILIMAAQASLRLVDVDAFCSVNGQEDRTQLDDFLKRLANDLYLLSDSITHTYLTLTAASRQLETMIAPAWR